jgi:teichuronic acid exporter
MFAWGVAFAAVVYPAFFIGIRWGVIGVAVAYAVVNGALIVPELMIAFRVIGLPVRDLLRSVRGVFLGSVLMAGLVALLRHALLAAHFEPPAVLVLSAVTGILTYGGWLWLTDAEAVGEVRRLGLHLWQPGGAGR